MPQWAEARVYANLTIQVGSLEPTPLNKLVPLPPRVYPPHTHTYIIHNNDNKINLKPIDWKTQGSPVDLGSKLEEATQEVGA